MSDVLASYGDQEISQTVDEYFASMHRLAKVVHALSYQVRSKSIVGGCFGHGAFLMLSHSSVVGGLDRVDYFVAHADSRLIVGWGDSKPDALKYARAMLVNLITPSRLASECQKFKNAIEAAQEEARLQRVAAVEARRQEVNSAPVVASIPRRRRRIFDESKGQCHYCSTPLTLDGKWHIEHKMPKALGGGNEPGNLVASCVSCNHKKRDTTDVEFKAKLAQEKSA